MTGTSASVRPNSSPITVNCTQLLQNYRTYTNLYNDALDAYDLHPSNSSLKLVRYYSDKRQQTLAKYKMYCTS